MLVTGLLGKMFAGAGWPSTINPIMKEVQLNCRSLLSKGAIIKTKKKTAIQILLKSGLIRSGFLPNLIEYPCLSNQRLIAFFDPSMFLLQN